MTRISRYGQGGEDEQPRWEEEFMHALVLGGIAWNTMAWVDRFPDPRPQTVFANRSHTTVGSSGAGKAMNLASLGADVVLWGLVGDDAHGRAAVEVLTARGIDVRAQRDPMGTMRHMNLMDSDGDRISVFLNAGSQHAEVEMQGLMPDMADADMISVTIMDHCRQFLGTLRNLRNDVWVDLHDYDGVNPHHDEFIASADHLLMSSVAMPQWRPFLERQIDSGVKTAICTHGADGASGVSSESGWVHIDAVDVPQIVDTNGAGDAFLSGFVVEWLASGSLGDALHAGAVQASRAIESAELAP